MLSFLERRGSRSRGRGSASTTHRRALLVVFQGIDAGGKDGAIRHAFSGLNPAGVRVSSFKKPTETELGHDFLWRVHAQCPGFGEIGVFNRSHYEDVLVTRVHGLIDEPTWTRRYAQIRGFETHLAAEGTVTAKFFLHVSKEEQRKARPGIKGLVVPA